MMTFRPVRAFACAPALALALGACAGTYTGPVEVTRFVAENPAELGSGSIDVAISSGENERKNDIIETIYRGAILAELEKLGYSVGTEETAGQQAFANISSRQIIMSGNNSAAGVSVGGSTGSFGSGLGLGLSLALGGGKKDREETRMEVRITSQTTGETLWEGRAELVTSEDSAYNAPAANARALASALFKDFPGGNGETISVDIDDLEGPQ